jgi:CIC family chloride channel protein
MDASAGEPAKGHKGFSLSEWLRSHLSDTQRYTVIWTITGVACGLAAVLFHISISYVTETARGWAHKLGEAGGSEWYGYLGLLLMPTVGGLVTGLILWKWAPHAAGSGIPQTKVRYYRDFGFFRLREAFWRFFLGTISVGFGMSLGREGPTVHVCAAISSKIGQWFGIAKKRVQAMVPLGMGAGIAAAFNAPMAAVFFVFEELLGDFSSKSFFGIFLAVVIAAVTNRLILGEHPAFDIHLHHLATDWWMLLCVPLGLAAAFLGRGFVASLLWARAVFRRSPLPIWLRPAAGGLSVGLIGVAVLIVTEGHMGIFGIGYDDADHVLNGEMVVLGTILLLLGGKFAATILAYASGGSGGLFAPTLFIGAMLGGAFGVVGWMLFDFDVQVVGSMALLGMGAFFAAVIRCPMTSIVIIWEMTGYYSLILPLMAGNMLAWIVNSRLQAVPLYDALLLQDRISLRRMPHYKGDQDWRNLPVSTIMTFDMVSVGGEETVGAAPKRLISEHHKHHAYPVIDETGELLGMITHHEMEEAAQQDPNLKVRSILPKRSLVSVKPDDSIREVARVLVVEDVMQVPVVSVKDGRRALGVVTLHDIARQQNAIDESLSR